MHTRRADILIVAAGRPQMITADMVKPGAVVIDVGMNRIPDATKKSGTRLVGDVDFDACARSRRSSRRCRAASGTMTIAMLMREHGSRGGASSALSEQCEATRRTYGARSRALVISSDPPPPRAEARAEPPRESPSRPRSYEELGDTVPGRGAVSRPSRVSTLTQTARDILEGAFMPLWVRGEVSDFKAHRNGHWYFCLRDRQRRSSRASSGRAISAAIPAPPDDGMQVTALGQLTVYAARGEMQFTVRRIEAEGDGLWRKALERTRARLEADGLLAPRAQARAAALSARHRGRHEPGRRGAARHRRRRSAPRAATCGSSSCRRRCRATARPQELCYALDQREPLGRRRHS